MAVVMAAVFVWAFPVVDIVYFLSVALPYHSVNGSGYNEQYGLLGSNKATEDKIKLFPHQCEPMLYEIQNIILRKTGKKVEVMVYGDKGTPVILVQGYFDNYTSE